jgi:hypothetical protein
LIGRIPVWQVGLRSAGPHNPQNAIEYGTVDAQAWTAQHRLHRHYQRFAARWKARQHIVTAIARELTGLVWAALTQSPDRPTVERRTLEGSMRMDDFGVELAFLEPGSSRRIMVMRW